MWRMCELLGSYSLSFTPSWTGCCLDKSPHLPTRPMLSFSMIVDLLATNPIISLHVPTKTLPLFLFLVTRGLAGWCSYYVSPFLHQSFAQGFLGLLFTSLLLITFWALLANISCCANPFYYFILLAFSAHLIFLYFFYSHKFFTKFFGLPWPNYHIFTFYYFLDLLVFKPTHLIY